MLRFSLEKIKVNVRLKKKKPRQRQVKIPGSQNRTLSKPLVARCTAPVASKVDTK